MPTSEHFLCFLIWKLYYSLSLILGSFDACILCVCSLEIVFTHNKVKLLRKVQSISFQKAW